VSKFLFEEIHFNKAIRILIAHHKFDRISYSNEGRIQLIHNI